MVGNLAAVAEMSGTGDNTLVARYLEGNDQAFEVLMLRYKDKVVNYIFGMIRDYDRAIDLSQEAFIRVFKNANRYEGKYQFSTWLYRIATNLAIDELRSRQRKDSVFHNFFDFFARESGLSSLPDVRLNPEKTYDKKERRERLEKAIDSLPPKYKLPFILKEVQELSYEETAAVLNISLGTVKSRIHRSKMLLREKLSGVL